MERRGIMGIKERIRGEDKDIKITEEDKQFRDSHEKFEDRFRNFEGKFKTIIFEGNTQRVTKLKAKDGFLYASYGDVKYLILCDPTPEKVRSGYRLVFYVDSDTGVTFNPSKPDLGLSPKTLGALFDDRFIRTVFNLDISKKTLYVFGFFMFIVGLIGGLIL